MKDEMRGVTIVKVPPDVKEQSLKDIAKFMGDRPYRIEVHEPGYGWNGLIPVAKGEG